MHIVTQTAGIYWTIFATWLTAKTKGILKAAAKNANSNPQIKNTGYVNLKVAEVKSI